MRSRLAFLTAALLAGSAACTVELDRPEDIDELDQALAGGGDHRRWPVDADNTVYYFIDTAGDVGTSLSWQDGCNNAVAGAGVNTSDPDNDDMINDAIARYESETPLRFEPVSDIAWHNQPVMFFTGGNSSNAKGDIDVPDGSLSDYAGCVYLPQAGGVEVDARLVQHEMGHLLGLIHEQKRSDRNTFVMVDTPCLGSDSNYAIDTSSQNLSPYDIDSVMHYDTDPTSCGTFDILLNNCSGLACCTTADPSCGCPASEPNCRKLVKSTKFSKHDRNVLYRMFEPELGDSELGDGLGEAMTAGDFDGDGYDDLAVGAPFETPPGDPATGVVFLYKGTEGGLVAWKLLTESQSTASVDAGDQFGAALASKDVDNDGDEELFIGAPGYKDSGFEGSGAVFLLRGDPEEGPLPHSSFKQSIIASVQEEADDRFGSSILVAKLDGSRHFVVIGAPGEVYSGKKSGAAIVLSAPVDTTTFAYHQTLHPGQLLPANDGDAFGTALAAADWNGDGITDLAVAAPDASPGGEVLFYRGGTSLAANSYLYQSGGIEFGAALTAGRYRGESWPSGKRKELVAIGAPAADGARGRIYVYRSTNTGTGGYFGMALSQILDQSTSGLGMTVEANDRFGEVLRSRNLDNDASDTDELVVGVPHEEVDGKANCGAVAILRGQAGAALTGWGHTVESADWLPVRANDSYGTAVAIGAFGDRNDNPAVENDNFLDVAVGAPGRDAGDLFEAASGVYAQNAGAFQELMGQSGSLPAFRMTFVQDVATPE